MSRLIDSMKNIDRVIAFAQKTSTSLLELVEGDNKLVNPNDDVMKDLVRAHHGAFGLIVETMKQAEEEQGEVFPSSDDSERMH